MTNGKLFADYKKEGHFWITLASGEYYPDILVDACELYEPILRRFSTILKSSESSEILFKNICREKEQWTRTQLQRVFRKYVCPRLSVEMLKKKTKCDEICHNFREYFRPIQEVQAAFSAREIPDEALCAVLWEYKDRGQKGYDLTERFFELFRSRFQTLKIIGPERAGKDIRLGTILKDYPKPDRPVDFVIIDPKTNVILAIGLARYDSDRGGAQEDDRTGGYQNCANEILGYAKVHTINLKVIFINDGPGLLLGSMWDDYARLEQSWPEKILVLTLRMVPERLTLDWLYS